MPTRDELLHELIEAEVQRRVLEQRCLELRQQLGFGAHIQEILSEISAWNPGSEPEAPIRKTSLSPRVSSKLEKLKEKFQKYRSTRTKGSGRSLPQHLWEAAIELARQGNIWGIAKELGLEGRKLKRYVEGTVPAPVPVTVAAGSQPEVDARGHRKRVWTAEQKAAAAERMRKASRARLARVAKEAKAAARAKKE